MMTTTATTSSRWIRPPPMCPMNPSNHNASNTKMIVYNIEIFPSVREPLHSVRLAGAHPSWTGDAWTHLECADGLLPTGWCATDPSAPWRLPMVYLIRSGSKQDTGGGAGGDLFSGSFRPRPVACRHGHERNHIGLHPSNRGSWWRKEASAGHRPRAASLARRRFLHSVHAREVTCNRGPLPIMCGNCSAP